MNFVSIFEKPKANKWKVILTGVESSFEEANLYGRLIISSNSIEEAHKFCYGKFVVNNISIEDKTYLVSKVINKDKCSK